MTSVESQFLAFAARFLEQDESQAVIGDLTEAGETGWGGVLEVLGLLVRRQVALWHTWRPWLAGFGIALPCSWTLMGISVSICWACQHSISSRRLAEADYAMPDHLMLLLCRVFLLVACSWTGGYIIGAISRRTLWISAALCFSPCLFCLARFRIESLSRFSLLLFLLPAIYGVRQGLLLIPIKRQAAVVVAGVATVAMVLLWNLTPRWILNWALIWPVWCLVAAALIPNLRNTLFLRQEIDLS